MNGERPEVNGHKPLDGATATQHHQAIEAKIARSSAHINGVPSKTEPEKPYVNGVHLHEPTPSKNRAIRNGLEQAPPEILDLVSREHYLPIASLINRRTQTTWGGISRLLNSLAEIDVPIHHAPPGALIKNQTRENLNKKELILEFLRKEKEDFIKLLVLVQWGKQSENVARTISLSHWLAQRRQTYWGATAGLAALKRDAIGFQIPNPDITTAGEVLSTGKVSSFPDIGYSDIKSLSRSQILAVLERLNRTLSLRLSLLHQLPSNFRNFTIRDGRATFVVPKEFEVDLSVLEESLDSPFRLVDFHFAFRPRPAVPDHLRSEIERLANDEIDSNGLEGCYQFLHELTLSNKLIEFHRQALDLAQGQWGGQARVQLLRRNLVVQYWVGASTGKSWLDIGINKASLGTPSCIAVRWFREGKEVIDFRHELDLVDLSVETLISQIIAQHSSWILDSLYDRLVGTSLFEEDGLKVEQSVSDHDPEDCFLQIQVNRSQEIVVAIDPVTGNVKISPASDHASRLQLELNRSRSLAQDFAPILLNYRCVVAERIVSDAISDTAWERLGAFRPSSADIRAVIAGPTIRINFFRHPTWAKEYVLAIRHGSDGDEFMILQQLLNRGVVSFASSRVVFREVVSFSHELKSESFEALADYTSRLIIVHSTASDLQRRGWKCSRLPDSGLEEEQSPHLLSFDIGSRSDINKSPTDSERSSAVQLEYINLEPRSKVVNLSATIQTEANSNVLARLSASNPDQRITFSPKERQIAIRVSSVVGKSAIDEVVAHVTRVHDLATCIQTIQGHTTMTMTSISMTAMTIAYEIGGLKDQRMHIRLADADTQARIDFQPMEANPHVRLAESMSRMLNEKGRPFAARLKDAISSLSLTSPLINCLRELERSLQPENFDALKLAHSKIQAHILVRQPTMFALQFFTRPGAQANMAGPQTRLLARFEILPQSHGRNSWLVRPAMEEFNQYSKASFASPALQAKVKDEVFAKVSPDWVRLDTAAVCPADKPQPLLKAIQQVMMDWVDRAEQQAQAALTAQAPMQAQGPPQPPLKPAQQTSSAAPNNSNAGNRPVQKLGQGRPNQGPNGMTPQQQRLKIGPGRPSQTVSKKQDVITID